MSNKVLITNSQKAVKVPSGLRILIRRACNAVLEYEHFDEPAEISVTFVDNAAIAEMCIRDRTRALRRVLPGPWSVPLSVPGAFAAAGSWRFSITAEALSAVLYRACLLYTSRTWG